jgi:hypothetical protein
MTQLAESMVDATRERVRLVQNGLVMIASAIEGTSEAFREQMLAPYRTILDELYEEDLPLAKLADNSDLLLHVSGPAASGRAPRVALLTRFMTSTRDEVTRLAKRIAGSASLRVPSSLDMSLVGMANGSLFIGFSASDASGEGDATREAVEAIGLASRLVAGGASLDTLAEQMPDPASRDIAIAAVRHLAPSGNIGVNEVELLGRRIGPTTALTTASRRNARAIMSRPLGDVSKPVQLVGTVREVDLDANRFELRNVPGNELDVRCAHELSEAEAKDLIDKRVRVTGRPEFARGASGTGVVRLLWVDEVEPLDD